VRAHPLDLSGGLDAAYAWHDQIHQDDIGDELGAQAYRGFP
jgi:hypothetical protein